MKPPNEFIKRILIATAIYIVIAVAAFCPDKLIQWEKNHGCSPDIVSWLHLMGRVLLWVDSLGFFIFLALEMKEMLFPERAADSSSKPDEKKPDEKPDLKRPNKNVVVIIVTVVVLGVVALLWIMEQPSGPRVRILQHPKFDAAGGNINMDEISGDVLGIDNPSDYLIVIYSHTDDWHVQPYVDRYLTPIGSSGKWSASIHLGDQYTAYLLKGTNCISKNFANGQPASNEFLDSQTVK